MSPAAYNLLEAIVRTTITIADNTLTKDRADAIRTDLTGKLTSLKVVMQHEKDESLLQPMAQVILALGKHVLGRPVKVSDGDVSQKDLLGIMQDLQRRSEVRSEAVERLMCPTCGSGDLDTDFGRCRCCGFILDGRPEPVIEDRTNEDIGLDSSRWKLLTDSAGYPVLALYFNGRKDSLSQEQVEEIEETVLPIIRRWGR
jgi:hypothetical protein